MVQFIMWFSGLRGAIAFSLVLNLQSHSLTALSPETKAVLVTTTLVSDEASECTLKG